MGYCRFCGAAVKCEWYSEKEGKFSMFLDSSKTTTTRFLSSAPLLPSWLMDHGLDKVRLRCSMVSFSLPEFKDPKKCARTVVLLMSRFPCTFRWSWATHTYDKNDSGNHAGLCSDCKCRIRQEVPGPTAGSI